MYGFPKDEALNIALSEIGRFLLTHEMKITLVVLDRKAFELSEQQVGRIEQYIDEHGASLLHQAEYGGGRDIRRRRTAQPEEVYEAQHIGTTVFSEKPETAVFSDEVPPPGVPDVAGKSLDEVLDSPGETFQRRLFRLIDASGMDDVTVYKKANIDRKVFSRIRCKSDYMPKKKTAVAFAVALELDLPATLDLLSRAGFTLSPSSLFDLIVAYHITNRIYDIFEINAALFRYGQPILGE